MVKSSSITSPKTVLLTGASRGIGQAISQAFSEKPGYIVLTPTRDEMDVADPDSIVSYLKRTDYRVDVLINNAGENKICTLAEMELGLWNRGFCVNTTAPMLLIKYCSLNMVQNNWGRIVNVSSIYSKISRIGRATYSSSKSALDGLTRAAALELAHANVLVNSICPGFVETDLTKQNNSPEQLTKLREQVPLRRLAQPEEIARTVYFLASDENTFITGQTIVADGGFTIQ